jgi:hypothetical protein
MDFVEKSLKCGLTVAEIASKLHVSYSTVQNRIYEMGLKVYELRDRGQCEGGQTGYNCRPAGIGKHDCIYWSQHEGTCDYILREHKRRPCPANNCTVYQKRSADYDGRKIYSLS